MRAHGVTNFPDPILGGHFGFMTSSGINPHSPQYVAAYRYCGTRYLHIHFPSPAELAREKAAAVKYANCMRTHGMSDFPGPDSEAEIELPTDNYDKTSKFQRGMQACKSLYTGKGFVLGVHFPAG